MMREVEDDVVIRPATRADLPELLRLYGQLAEERAEAQPADADAAARILGEVQADPHRELFVAVRNGRVLGTADVVVVPNLTHGGKPWAIVENVAVHERDRRRGVATRLMVEIERRVKRAGCYKIQLLSRKHREVAHAFYETLGFEATAEGFRRNRTRCRKSRLAIWAAESRERDQERTNSEHLTVVFGLAER
jgi:ribosomal protein S18 acetylase RimI-like enzyme